MRTEPWIYEHSTAKGPVRIIIPAGLDRDDLGDLWKLFDLIKRAVGSEHDRRVVEENNLRVREQAAEGTGA